VCRKCHPHESRCKRPNAVSLFNNTCSMQVLVDYLIGSQRALTSIGYLAHHAISDTDKAASKAFRATAGLGPRSMSRTPLYVPKYPVTRNREGMSFVHELDAARIVSLDKLNTSARSCSMDVEYREPCLPAPGGHLAKTLFVYSRLPSENNIIWLRGLAGSRKITIINTWPTPLKALSMRSFLVLGRNDP